VFVDGDHWIAEQPRLFIRSNMNSITVWAVKSESQRALIHRDLWPSGVLKGKISGKPTRVLLTTIIKPDQKPVI
jgi:hypothetical protein